MQRRFRVVNDYTEEHAAKVGFPSGHPVLRRFISIPIFEKDRVVGVAALGNKQETYNPGDVRQFRLLMEGLGQIMQRKQADEALRKSEEKFRNFTEQSLVGFYIIQDGFFKYVNPKFAAIFGYTADECLDNMLFHHLVHPKDLAIVKEQVRKRIDGEIAAVQYSFRGIKKTGEIIHVAIYGSSLFNIYLPLMVKVSDSIPKDAVESSPSGSERILLVDDEDAIARIEKQMLERLGYRVTSRVSSLEALEAFKASPESYDLVITDMSMPNMTGDRLARKLIAVRPDIPVIICTGFSDRMNPDQAKAMGIKGFLMKPVVKTEMATLVRHVLDEAKFENQGE